MRSRVRTCHDPLCVRPEEQGRPDNGANLYENEATRTLVMLASFAAVTGVATSAQADPGSNDSSPDASARSTLGFARVHRQTDAKRHRGQQLLAEVGELYLRRGYFPCDLPLVNVYVARERARRGDRDGATPLMRAAVDHLFREGQLLGWGIPATGVLVETLLDRADESDVGEAKAAIDRLARRFADDYVLCDIWLLRVRALLARAHGDAVAYAHFRDRYRYMAKTLEFEGHIAWAEAMA